VARAGRMGSCPKPQSADSAAPSKITMTNTSELTLSIIPSEAGESLT